MLSVSLQILSKVFAPRVIHWDAGVIASADDVGVALRDLAECVFLEALFSHTMHVPFLIVFAAG